MSQETRAPRGDPSAPGAREEVLDCAARLLDEVGREGLTIRRLAAESGFTPPAIYSLFGDKAGLMEAIVQRGFADIMERLRKIENPGDPRDYIRRAFRELVRFGREHHHQFEMLEAHIPAASLEPGTVDPERFRLSAPLLELAGTDGMSDESLELIRQACWVLLHGLIALPPMRREVAWREDLSDVLFEIMITGFLAQQSREEGGEAKAS